MKYINKATISILIMQRIKQENQVQQSVILFSFSTESTNNSTLLKQYCKFTGNIRNYANFSNIQIYKTRIFN